MRFRLIICAVLLVAAASLAQTPATQPGTPARNAIAERSGAGPGDARSLPPLRLR